MTATQFLIGVIASAIVFKFSVFIFAPDSENSLVRAVVTGLLAALSIVASDILPLLGAPAWSSLLGVFLGPLIVVKLSYELSFFRAFLVSGLYVVLWGVLSDASGIRVIRFEVTPEKESVRSL